MDIRRIGWLEMKTDEVELIILLLIKSFNVTQKFQQD